MAVKYEIVASTGEYQDKDGNTKRRYTKMGVVIEAKNGLMIKMECVPVGWDGFAYLNEPKTDNKHTSNKPAQSDDIPF